MTTSTAGKLRQPRAADVAVLILLGTLWGSTFLAIKLAVFDTGPVLLVFLRVVAAFIALAAYMMVKGATLPTERRDWYILFLMSILNSVVPLVLINWANLHITSGVAALIMGIGPLFTLFVTHITTSDDRFSMNKLAGMVIGLGGLAVIVGSEAMAGFTASLLGDAAMFGAISCYVIATSFVRKIRTTRKEGIATINMAMAAVMLLPVVLIIDTPPLASLSLTVWLSILYLGVIVTGAGYLLRYHLVLSVGQNYMAMASYVMPVVGVLLGALFLGEPLSPKIIIALVLVLAGFAVARSGSRSSE